jgi:hypothetical protein
MNTKANRVHTNGLVEFKHAGQGKWQFNHKAADGFTFEFKTNLTGGQPVAAKVANIVGGAMKRSEGRGLDNLARANITKIIG